MADVRQVRWCSCPIVRATLTLTAPGQDYTLGGNALVYGTTAAGEVIELIGGEGMELRVAVQHENNLAPASAEIHDASDDVYYVLEGSATLTLGGSWRSVSMMITASASVHASSPAVTAIWWP